MDREYVGVDVHRRRSVIVRKKGDGEVLGTTRIDNQPMALAAELAKTGLQSEVALKATYGYYWDPRRHSRGRLASARCSPLRQRLGTSKRQERRARR